MHRLDAIWHDSVSPALGTEYTKDMTTNFVVVLADGMVFPIVLAAAAALLYYVPNAQKITVYSRMLVAGLTSYMVAKFMSMAYQPSTMRPFELAGVEPGASFLNNPGFPSDHALFVWVIVLAVAYALSHKKWLWGTLAVLAALVCLGRVLALVHAPIDIVGGVAAAFIGALWYIDGRISLQKSKK